MKAIKALVAVACTCMLSACIDFNLDSKLKNDGSGEMEMTVTGPAGNPFDQEAELPKQEDLDKEAEEKFKTEKAKAAEAGVEMTSLSIKLEGDKKVEKSHIKFPSLEKLNKFFNQDDDGQAATKVSLEDKDGGKVFKMSMTTPKPEEEQDEQQMAMAKAMLKDAKMTLKWTFEGEISEISEGGKISEDKKTATWEIPLVKMLDGGFEVSATYK